MLAATSDADQDIVQRYKGVASIETRRLALRLGFPIFSDSRLALVFVQTRRDESHARIKITEMTSRIAPRRALRPVLSSLSRAPDGYIGSL